MRTKEGITELIVPEASNQFPPPKSKVFFNPEMESNRDLTVSIVSSVRPKKYIDAHAATGARGLRVAKEIKDIDVTLNDWSDEAIKYIIRNRDINDLDNVNIKNKDSRVLLLEKKFDFIDLDPFGSPVPFLESGIDSLLDDGVLGCTATDTAPLCGNHIKAGLRKYGARALRTPYHKEIGLRILLGKIIREGAAQDKALIPLVSYYNSHYFRVYLRNNEGAKNANQLFRELGYIQHCFSCGKRKTVKGLLPNLDKKCSCSGKYKNTGPLFLGEIQNPSFLKKIRDKINEMPLNYKEKNIELMDYLIKESGLPPTFYDIHKIAEINSTSAPKTKKLISRLQENGFRAVKTHFSDLGIKTDAEISEINDLFLSI